VARAGTIHGQQIEAVSDVEVALGRNPIEADLTFPSRLTSYRL